MKAYIGCKVVLAEPMSKLVASAKNLVRGAVASDEDGYCVHYPDGYLSWCPKATFEAANRLISAKEHELLDKSEVM